MTRISYDSRLDPQMREALAQQQAIAPDIGTAHTRSAADIREVYERERAYWNEGGPAMASSLDITLDGPIGVVPIRIYEPVDYGVNATLMFMHGGGWMVGSTASHDRIARTLADHCKCKTVSVDYRLAPEFKFPVQFEECLAVLHALKAGEIDNCPGQRLLLAGDSAGANLALGLALWCRDRHPGLVSALALFYGTYGLRDSGSRRLYGNGQDGMSHADLTYYRRSYLRSEADMDDPRYNMLDADLSDMPPAYIMAAELDPVKDDSLTLAAQYSELGISHELSVYDGMLHGFLHMSRICDKARHALQAGAKFLCHQGLR